MSLSIFILTLWVFLQSAAERGWFTVDPRLISLIGLAFVAAVLLETFFIVFRGRPLLPVRAWPRRSE